MHMIQEAESPASEEARAFQAPPEEMPDDVETESSPTYRISADQLKQFQQHGEITIQFNPDEVPDTPPKYGTAVTLTVRETGEIHNAVAGNTAPVKIAGQTHTEVSFIDR